MIAGQVLRRRLELLREEQRAADAELAHVLLTGHVAEVDEARQRRRAAAEAIDDLLAALAVAEAGAHIGGRSVCLR